jgi:hypothetical protein
MENFNSNLDNLLSRLFDKNPNSFFMDSNINLLKLANSKISTDYLETVHSNGYLQLISKAPEILAILFNL